MALRICSNRVTARTWASRFSIASKPKDTEGLIVEAAWKGQSV